ncbi:transient receptor potential cation channel subfamily V member 5 [Diaphorina citri]|uniref:Transient receptor potential cation channel subfamily V member 5 n=1 Tax=Diaphorina citri TaxID=121845 RepID=A0A1S4E9G3_DIACI|nr:transient receptor potential cation channel subfamily V member 5 [Diaphorina citri]
MGNTESNVTSGVKKQADTSSIQMYNLVDLKGGGLLVELMKKAAQTKNYAELDEAIKTKVEPFLYNKGEGKLIPVSQLVLMRNKERPRHKLLGPLRNMDNPDDFDIEKDIPPQEEVMKWDPSKYRDVCWNLTDRGAVGETVLHLCLLNATSIHADLAKRLLRFYPKLVNDIYMCDEYYGESVLHLAIVNEDPAMVKFFLDNGANYHERCFGNFMCPEDQKASRTDSLDHEWVNLSVETNYEGYVYWGEYPLTFAACLNQEECYRLMLARGANPDSQDTNGNTVLHLLTIYEKIQTFDMAYELGADLSVRNIQNLTPLTLAAKLARIEMFFHILNIEREIYWQIGSITCAAYPLSQIDTIDIETGNISKTSALNLVVFGDKDEHLELMDGVLVDLLNAKWNAFVKFRFYRQFFQFFIYFLISLVCFTLRPGPIATHKEEEASNNTSNANSNEESFENTSSVMQTTFTTPVSVIEKTKTSWWQEQSGKCRLLKMNDYKDIVRLLIEFILEIGAFLYLFAAMREAGFLGYNMFVENLMTAPSRVMFLFSCCLMMVMPVLRFTCQDEVEDIAAVIIMLTTSPYFLFFCRGFKTVGPFVVMIYRMIMGDLLRFVSIYLVFVMGFSQSYYIIHLSFDNPLTPGGVDDTVSNPMPNPTESIMAMFLMSLTTFGDYYTAFETTEHAWEAKLCFVIFMAIVAILLVNMLIAMMGNTYQKIAETRNEWQRQWARIVLVVERGVPPKERLTKLMWYSQPMSDGRRALVLRLNQTEEDKEEMKEMLEMKRIHNKMVEKRARGKRMLSASPSPKKLVNLAKASPLLK